MNREQLVDLISHGESKTLEFKKSTTQLKPAFETLCAFLNSVGGKVLIGVTDNGRIQGQQISDATKQELAREIAKIEPKVAPTIDYVALDDNKFVISIDVPAGKHIPYTYDYRPYERNESTTEKMNQHRFEQLMIKRGQLNHSWALQPALGYNLDDLDHEEIRRTIKEGVDQNRISVEVLTYDIEHILKKLRLLIDGQLVNAAVVLYAKTVEPHYARCMIKMARFQGTDKIGDFLDNQRVYANAFQLIRAALDFVNRHLPISSYFKPNQMQRIDQPAVPQLALREALINAISHRDYTNGAANISLAIYDDRLELWNIGGLSKDLTLDDLKKRHDSHSRNEVIASVFYQRSWVEGWGTGTLRMLGYCQQNDTPEPIFDEYSGGFSVTFPFKHVMHTVLPAQDLSSMHLSLRQEEILTILKNHTAMRATDIRAQLKNPPAERTLRDDLARLKKLGYIDSQGHAKTATWYLINKDD